VDNFATCNAVAAALTHQKETKFNTIVVGAIAGSGGSENIANYSNRAGALAQRYLMARGDAYGLPGGGTSFAAPRVAGAAAILKQRYPSLTGKQIADVLLLSANKDINNDGTPDFEGVSLIYGHGKLDLQRAMQLAEVL
jgi:subtilisin family serine protease